MTDTPEIMTLIPAGTLIQPPDDIGRVVFMFQSKNDAILFFEYFREQLVCKEYERKAKP